MQDSVEAITVHHLSEHHTVNVGDKHGQSRAELLTDGHKHANKRRSKTHSVIPDGVASSEYDDASKIEGQRQKTKTENVATSDTEQHAHSQIDQQLQPYSGVKDVSIRISIVFDILILIE